MLIPRQLAPTVGPAHGGVEFLKGFSSGIEKIHNILDEEELVREDLHQLRVYQVQIYNR